MPSLKGCKTHTGNTYIFFCLNYQWGFEQYSKVKYRPKSGNLDGGGGEFNSSLKFLFNFMPSSKTIKLEEGPVVKRLFKSNQKKYMFKNKIP